MIIVRGNVSVEKTDRDKASDTQAGRKIDVAQPEIRFKPHKSSKSYSYVGSLNLRLVQC